MSEYRYVKCRECSGTGYAAEGLLCYECGGLGEYEKEEEMV